MIDTMHYIVFGVLLLGAHVAHGARLRPVFALRELQEDCRPQQVHIALADDPSRMHVTWKTAGANCRSEVSWWADRRQGRPTSKGLQWPWSGNALKAAVGYSFLLSERDMCEEPAASNVFQLYLHRAVMTDLVPGTRYRYQIADGGMSWPFRAQPRSSPSERLNFVAFGDMGESEHRAAKSPGAAATLSMIEDLELPGLDLVLHVGDISYADGDPVIWDTFMDAIEPLSARLPYMVQVGNHEYGYDSESGAMIDPSGGRPYAPSWGNFGPDSGGECGVMLARRFHMPARAREDNPPFWYGFDYGSVHFTAISTEHDLSPGSLQYRWLERELASVDRCRTPWLVLLLHRPMYVVYPHKSNRQVGEHIRDSLEGLLKRYMVDLAISGHVHSYYRTCAVYDERCMYGVGASRALLSDAGAAAAAGGVGSETSSSSRTTAAAASSTAATSSSNGSAALNRGGGDDDDYIHGIVHVIVGSGGRKLSALEDGQEDWVAAAERVWGYSRFSVDSEERMTAEFVESETGAVLDRFEVVASDARLRNACPRRSSK